MFVGTVVGTVVAPVHHPFYDGKTLLLVRTDRAEDGAPVDVKKGGTVLAVDRVGAGIGERVLVMKEGSSARTMFGEPDAPVRTVIVGIVDEIEVFGKRTFFKGDA